MELFSFNINQDKILKLLSNDRSGLKEVYNKLSERNFYIGETEIARKTLNDWQSESLLPFTNNEKGWTKFSLVEFVWLKCISELRMLGLPLENIKKVKDFFFKFDIEEYKALFLGAIESFAGDLQEREQVLSVFKLKDISEKIWLEAMQELQISVLTILILEVLVNNHNLCFTIDKEDKIQIVVLGNAMDERMKKNEATISQLMDASFVLVNLRKIVQSFFSSEKIKYDNDFIIAFLNSKEKKIIEMIQKGNIKAITVRFGKNYEPTHIELTNNKITEKMIGQVARLMKKGQYSSIILKQENGKLVNYEKKEIMKL